MSQPSCDTSAYPPIEDYGLVGDCHTAALVSRQGSIDWYCPGRFDAPAVLCRLLDVARGGYLWLAPAGTFSAERGYLERSNVLSTTFSCDAGKVRVTDLMAIHSRQQSRRGYDVGTARRLLRLVEGVAGEVEMEVAFKPTFDYARARTALHPTPWGAVAETGDDSIGVELPGVKFEPHGEGELRGRFRLRQGERRWLAFGRDVTREGPSAAERCERELQETLSYWRTWADHCTYQGPYREQVLRSVLALKLLTYEPTGALVAAPTTSLPEEFGGARNWDYRFTWLRDSALILYALMTVGFSDEAGDFFRWLEKASGHDAGGAPQIMYTIDGGKDLPEVTLGHLEGYACSRPVRVGNGAAKQRQLDIFGEVLSAAYLHYRRGGERASEGQEEPERPPPETWDLLRSLVEQAARDWQEPDQGIWEVRGGPQRFLYSRLMCWAALDRGIRLAQEHRLEAPLGDWKQKSDEIRHAILHQGYDHELGAFTQAFGSKALDASALVIPRIGFLPPTDARVRSTVQRIQERLTHDGLVYRYRTRDGLPGGEGMFMLCTFWLVDALALGGQLDEAHDLFERALRYANDLGLLSEEIDPAQRRMLGNFPQGFTHLALVGSAVNLAKAAAHGAEEEPENEAQRASRAHLAAAQGHSRKRQAA